MENVNKMYDLKVEKMISKTPAEVFRAISEGRLFLNCGADQKSLKIDFKVGGSYSIEFGNYQMKNRGEFLEIVTNQKIVFTWCQDFESNPTPDTKVLIELKDLGGKTGLTLTHSGFTDLENKDAHQGGWNSGLDDLTQEITQGKLRLIRKLPLSIEKLFDFCKSGKIKGDLVEYTPNKKIVFKQQDTKATLLFDTDDDDQNVSWLELIHEGLQTESQQKSQREEWDSLFKKI